MAIIDTHAHLSMDKLQADIENILLRAQTQGVSKIINIACNPESVNIVLQQLNLSPSLYAALGIQPHDAQLFTPQEGLRIKNLAAQNKRVVAIGEIGLDAHYTHSPLDKQIECFEYFLNTALELKLPIVVHVRETHKEVYKRLLPYAKAGGQGVIHCFTGTKAEAFEFLDCGFYISFSGIVTFKNAHIVQDTAKHVPDNKILIETDSPYLAPMPLRGKTNEPSFITHTCQFLANLRNMPMTDFANLTYNNSIKLFNL